jgi:hypothetical protein
MIRRRLALGLVFPFLILRSAGGAVIDFTEKVPVKIGSWEAREKDRTFDRRTLYDYMDGGAEVFLAFDLRQVWVRKYAGPGKSEIILDVYEMGSAAEAFGLFSCDRQDPGVGIGQDSEYGPGLLRFWQGKYFVAVTISSDDEAAGKAALELGRALVPLLGPPGPRPELLAVLPEESLRRDRTSYFHGVVNLNNRFFVSSDNILKLDRSTECVFAEYGPPAGEPTDLLVVKYPDAEAAGAARHSFLAAYLPEAGPDGSARTENGKWVAASLHGKFLAVVFDAPSRDRARALAAGAKFPAK